MDVKDVLRIANSNKKLSCYFTFFSLNENVQSLHPECGSVQVNENTKGFVLLLLFVKNKVLSVDLTSVGFSISCLPKNLFNTLSPKMSIYSLNTESNMQRKKNSVLYTYFCKPLNMLITQLYLSFNISGLNNLFQKYD
jgi:hypothetical protein